MKLLYKNGFSKRPGEPDVPVVAYFGPEAGQPKGQNVAVSGAMDGVANVTEGISGFSGRQSLHHNLNNP